MTASFDTAYLASKLSGGIVASSTYTPLPWRDSTRPTDFMRDTASLTTVRLTENCSASSGSVGSLSRGRKRPERISADKASATRSESRALGAIAGKWVGLDIELVRK